MLGTVERMEPLARRSRRSGRDWLVDSVLFVCAAAYGVVVSGLALEDPRLSAGPTLFTLDQLVGVLACVSLWWRRRFPLQIGIALTLAAAFSETSAGAMVIGLFSVAAYLGLRAGVAVFALSIASALAWVSWRMDGPEDRWVGFAVGCAMHAAAAGWGVALHQRRSLLAALRERAEQAEERLQLAEERTRRESRDEIAREIHDVLGHRLSLLSVHAGALEYRSDPQPEEMRQAAGVIRRSAHDALQDLREVIGVLRAPALDAPQPSLRDLGELADQAREAGTRVTLGVELSEDPPAPQQRAAYRIVQEGLTNARKHAREADVDIRVEGDPGVGITVTVVNTASGAPAPAAAGREPGAGSRGLLGLGERVRHLQGRIEYGPSTGRGGWELRAWLPWMT